VVVAVIVVCLVTAYGLTIRWISKGAAHKSEKD
jgi:hypothetical protein